jgi:hypothetical protein
MHLFTIEDLSKILHKSISTLQTDLYRAPHRLPPMIVGARLKLTTCAR